MDKVTPKCPYCGTEMELDRTYKSMMMPGASGVFWYSCDVCGAEAPRCNSEESAHAAAMERYVEPNRVLTFEEIMNLDPDGTTCVEERRTGAIKVILNFEILEGFAEVLRDGGQDAVKKAHGHSYGRFSRAWLRRPTDEERASTPWTQNDA